MMEEIRGKSTWIYLNMHRNRMNNDGIKGAFDRLAGLSTKKGDIMLKRLVATMLY